MHDMHESNRPSVTYSTGNVVDDDYIARIKAGYQSMSANAKVTYGRLGKKAGIDRRTVEKIMQRYPSQFKHIKVQRSHVAGR